MSESYVECLIKSKDNTTAKALRVLFIVLAVVSVAAIFYFGQSLIFIATILFGVGAYIASRYVHVEYEYLYLDKELVIDRIYNQAKRKRIGTYSFDKVAVIAPVKSYHLANFGKLSDKPKDYSIGIEEQPDRRYVMFYENNEQILISPNEELVKAMKLGGPRKVFSD